jgi:hypothetical protein
MTGDFAAETVPNSGRVISHVSLKPQSDRQASIHVISGHGSEHEPCAGFPRICGCQSRQKTTKRDIREGKFHSWPETFV